MKRVLILDDNPDNCQELQNMLDAEFPEEIETETFMNADCALRAVEENSFKLLIVDYLLPGQMSGITFIEKARDLDRSLNIILVSAVVATGSPIELELKDQLDAKKCLIPGSPIMMFSRPISKITFTSFVQFILKA